MAALSLYQRLKNQGTISEPKGIPDPNYALPSTVNWMRSICMLIENKNFNYQTTLSFYAGVNKKVWNEHVENSIFEHLLLALHQLSALKALKEVPVQSDITRVASVAWYYGIYACATAMVAAQTGSLQDNHTQTANSWDSQFSLRNLAISPFDLRVSTCIEKIADSEINTYRSGPKKNLVNPPESINDAHGYVCSYLSGTRGWWAWRAEQDIRKSKDFKNLNVSDFRTKAARDLRDRRLSGQAISFLHQAIRFRGKANYREALYLAHGKHVESIVSDFTSDMHDVLESFLIMAGAFSFKRLGDDLRDGFIEDVEKHRSFDLNPLVIWS